MSLKRRLIFEVCANCGRKIVDDEKAILVDDHNDLIFCSDSCLKENFESEVERLEDEHMAWRAQTDIPLQDFKAYEHFLELLLNDPEEIWELESLIDQTPLCFLMSEFIHDQKPVFYVAAVYLADHKPTFVYMHFPTNDPHLVEKYRRGQLIYSNAEPEEEGEIVADNLEEDGLGHDLYMEMLELRSDQDIDIEEFPKYAHFKLTTIEKPNEIWRRVDDEGNTLLIYYSTFSEEDEVVHYIVVGIEDEFAEGMSPIFGFPTVDSKLLDHFRSGELVFKALENF